MAAILQTSFWNQFLECILLNADSNFFEACFQRLSCEYINNISNNGLMPNIQQDITWADDTLLYWRIWASLVLGEL